MCSHVSLHFEAFIKFRHDNSNLKSVECTVNFGKFNTCKIKKKIILRWSLKVWEVGN